MLFDYQDSNFNIPLHRFSEVDNITDPISKIAEALNSHKVKLNSTFARMCVSSSVLTISELIPDKVTRETFAENSHSPCYARVNDIKCNKDDMLAKLSSDGYKIIPYHSELPKSTKSACIIEDNFLAFSADCKELLEDDPWVNEGYLALQVCLLKK